MAPPLNLLPPGRLIGKTGDLPPTEIKAMQPPTPDFIHTSPEV